MRRLEGFVDELADRKQGFAGYVAGVSHFGLQPDESAGTLHFLVTEGGFLAGIIERDINRA